MRNIHIGKIQNSTFNSVIVISLLLFCFGSNITAQVRKTENFNDGWRFHLGEIKNANSIGYDDSQWRELNLPHDWSIEGTFSPENPATVGGGALPGGIGWYRKYFFIPVSENQKNVFIDFDGVYRNSEVWINGNYLGKRP